MKVLPRSLESLSLQTMSGYQITVVDNGSQDGSVEYIRSHWPDVRVLALPGNLGFCRAVNEGIRKSPAELIALLNNDAEAEPGWLEALYEASERYPEAGSFASKVLMADNRECIESVGDLLKSDACGANRGRGEPDRGQYDREEEVFSASGAAVLYRRALFEKIGLFDEDFFAYFEDIDLGFRAQRFGYPCVFVPRARVVHVGKASRPEDRNWHLRQEFVNSTLCQIKNLPTRYFIRNGRSICREPPPVPEGARQGRGDRGPAGLHKGSPPKDAWRSAQASPALARLEGPIRPSCLFPPPSVGLIFHRNIPGSCADVG